MMKAKMLEAIEQQISEGPAPASAWILTSFRFKELLLVHKFVDSFHYPPRPKHEMG